MGSAWWKEIDYSFSNFLEFVTKRKQQVKKMIILQKEMKKINLSTQKKILQRQINYTDQKLDSLICRLYSLNEKEIEIIEKAINN